MYEDFSDADLLGRLRSGSDSEKKEILLTLYERYKKLVLNIIYYHLRDYDLAGDVLHDVFVKVIEKAESIHNPHVFKSWLMITTKNLCVDHLRRSSYFGERELISGEIEVSCQEGIEENYIAEMDRQRILGHLVSCIKKLDVDHLSVFKLRWRGLRAAQILKIIPIDRAELRRSYDRIKNQLEACMKSKGFLISIDQIISLGEFDE